jgi:hypothetical protein
MVIEWGADAAAAQSCVYLQSDINNREWHCLLIALIVRRSELIICKHPRPPAVGPIARYSLAWSSWSLASGQFGEVEFHRLPGPQKQGTGATLNVVGDLGLQDVSLVIPRFENPELGHRALTTDH